MKNKNIVLAAKKNHDTNGARMLPSGKFRVQNVIKTVSDHFIACWEKEKSVSTKLSFYNECKHKFARESYLDVTKGFSRRYSTSKLRISAHDLEIEIGRYNKTPRDLRTCTWCKLSMGVNTLETEKHLLYECDLYSGLRNKLVTKLNNAPQHSLDSHPQLNVNLQSLKDNLVNLLSPYSHSDPVNMDLNAYNLHHNTKNTKLQARTHTQTLNSELEKRRAYIITCICSFIYRAMDKRHKYLSDVREREAQLNTLVIHFN